MGILDSLLNKAVNKAESSIKNAARSTARTAVNNAVSSASAAAGNASNKSETFTFDALPASVDELRTLPECDFSTPFRTAALCAAVLCNYESNVQETINMINVLKGPQALTPYETQFLRDRLSGKGYVPRSYFAGAVPSNNYTPDVPYSITISDNPYSYQNDGYAKLFLKSGGADSPRDIVLRRKGEEWYVWQIEFLSDIRTPAEQDPWA